MFWQIDFNSDEAIYVQLKNQIIIGIAADSIKEGDALPSVRQMADDIGINMHTVNKVYKILKDEGLISLDRRRGAIISIDINKLGAIEELTKDMRIVLAKAICRGIDREEIHDIVDEVYNEYQYSKN